MGFALNKPTVFWGLLVCVLVSTTLLVEAATPSAGPTSSLPPMPSKARSGIDYFRELLSADPSRREQLLAGKSLEHRRVLESGLRTYLAMRPEERELRLRTMELRFHLTSLLRTAPTNRLERLKSVPDKDRPLVEERLRIWDKLSPEDQKEALESERMIRVLGFAPAAAQREVPLTGTSSNQVRQIEQQLIRWQTLPEQRRREIQDNFNRLFELTEAEKARELPEHLSEAERKLMEKALDRFKTLSPSQRIQCVQAFQKFSELSPTERKQFLVSAEEWKRMKPEDRESWRRLVNKVPPMPPLPPGYGLPPLPSPVRPSSQAVQVTNIP